MCSYQIADKLPKGEFKNLHAALFTLIRDKTIIFNQCLASKSFKTRCERKNLLELVLITVQKKTYIVTLCKFFCNNQ